MRKSWIVIVLVGLVCLSSGCRTFVLGTTQEILITSKPSGATVEITGPRAPVPVTEISGGVNYVQPRPEWKAIGVTPLNTRLNRGQNYTVKVSMPGYRTERAQLRGSLGAGFWIGNLLTLPVFGHLMDWMSGAGFTLVPGSVEVTLKRTR